MNEQFVRDRITALRTQKGISEYKMSLDLGHSKGYIQGISSGRALPSMYEFLYMCDYLGITPKEFFDSEIENPEKVERLYQLSKNMPDDDLDILIATAERLNKKWYVKTIGVIGWQAPFFCVSKQRGAVNVVDWGVLSKI